MSRVALVSLLTFIFLFSISVKATENRFGSEKIKSVFIYHFIKNIYWSHEQESSEFTLAVYQDEFFFNSLKKILINKKIRNKKITLSFIKDIKKLAAFDVVYVPKLTERKMAKIALAIRLSGTLLVSEYSHNKKDVMINFIQDNEKNTLSFEINKSNIIYEKLIISDELLLLGGTELDVAMLYRETELAMLTMKKNEDSLKAHIVELKSDVKRRGQELQKNINTLLLLEDKLTTQQEKFELNTTRFSTLFKNMSLVKSELASNRVALKKQRIAFENKNKEIVKMEQQIVLKKKKLIDQRLGLEQQKQALKNKELAIKQKDQHIKGQEKELSVSYWFIALISFFTLLVVFLFIRNRKTTKQLLRTLNDLNDTQNQLVQSEKMASLGQLTAGIAHEINTPLGIVITSVSILSDNIEKLSKHISNNNLTKNTILNSMANMQQAINISNNSLTRVTQLISNFKQVAADHVVEESREINLSLYINEVVNTLSGELKKHRINYSFHGNEEATIITFPGAIAQILTNLITNAINHAFIDITDPNISIDVIESPLEQKTKIIFKDNGKGMTPEVLKKIYDPFFTTKRNQGGTGLGMNIVYNLISDKLKGVIKIDSKLDQGTLFAIILPKNVN